MEQIWAVSSLDGRYAQELQELRPFVSEGALIRFRLMVEASWLLHLQKTLKDHATIEPNPAGLAVLRRISVGDFANDILGDVKTHEQRTKHDVKAVEYALGSVLASLGADELKTWVHFACTSEDINNLSYSLMLQKCRSDVLLPVMGELLGKIRAFAVCFGEEPMLARTHGQTATPTTFGKEMAVFWRRLKRQMDRLVSQPIEGKLNGATGNFNAHCVAFPDLDWIAISKTFVEDNLSLQWNPLTTQIESHDTFVEFMDIVRTFNTILLDFCRDMWGYISLGYLAQRAVAGEVGSSTMPHKVNPIYFENAEGNLGVANALLMHFAEKLPVSRFQRDLSDSTVLRVTGTALGHTVLAWRSALKGLARVDVNQARLQEDLGNAWEVLGEAVQTVMRKHGVSDAYERLKTATRGQPVVTQSMILEAIDQCSEIPESEKKRLRELTPASYTGAAARLVKQFIPD